MEAFILLFLSIEPFLLLGGSFGWVRQRRGGTFPAAAVPRLFFEVPALLSVSARSYLDLFEIFGVLALGALVGHATGYVRDSLKI